MNRFGELLRNYRRESRDPERGGILTQERLGKLLGEALGDAGYTGAAISDWERGKSQIDKDYRRVLVALIKVLYQAGGLRTPVEADTLLLSGNYRPLDAEEKNHIFPEEAQEKRPGFGDLVRFVARLLGERFRNPGKMIQAVMIGPYDRPSGWSGALLDLIGGFFNRWSAAGVLRAILWICIWLLTWRLTFPMLHWPFDGREAAQRTCLVYGGAAILLPILVGFLANPRGNVFWKRQKLERSIGLQFFTQLGAQMGFHVGYMMVFSAALAGFYLHIPRMPNWLTGIAAAWPLVLGYASAIEVPFNQWRAFGQMRPKDGAVLLIFVLFGPLFGTFFYAFYPWLLTPSIGIPLLLLSIVIVATQTIWQQRRSHPATSG